MSFDFYFPHYKEISTFLYRFVRDIYRRSNMTTIIIEENSLQAKQLIEYIKTLPYVTVIEEKKKSFREAADECNAITVDTFFDELDDRIRKRF